MYNAPPAEKTLTKLTIVLVMYLPSNISTVIQPMDQGAMKEDLHNASFVLFDVVGECDQRECC